jgi:hypothetical protein
LRTAATAGKCGIGCADAAAAAPGRTRSGAAATDQPRNAQATRSASNAKELPAQWRGAGRSTRGSATTAAATTEGDEIRAE